MAFSALVNSKVVNKRIEKSLYNDKIAARFSGTMRKNLIEMLDQCDLPGILNIPSSSNLCTDHHEFLHTTSVIKYPVFVNDTHYTGYQPQIEHSPLLSHYAYPLLAKAFR